MALPPWYRRPLPWTHSAIPCSCSAADAGIALRRGTGRETDLFFFTNGWSPAASCGPGQQRRPECLRLRLMEGLSVDQPKAHKPVNGLEIVCESVSNSVLLLAQNMSNFRLMEIESMSLKAV